MFHRSGRSMLLASFGEPLRELAGDRWQAVAPVLPEKRASPQAAARSGKRLFIACSEALWWYDGLWHHLALPELSFLNAVVAVQDELLVFAARSATSPPALLRFRGRDFAEVPLEPGMAALLAGRLHQVPGRDGEVLLASEQAVGVLEHTGVRLVQRAGARLFDAARGSDGRLWLLYASGALGYVEAGMEREAWPPPPLVTSTWTDADGEPETETNTPVLGVLAPADPPDVYVYGQDRRLLRRSAHVASLSWPAPASHRRFLTDMAHAGGRLWALVEVGGFGLLEAVPEPTPGYQPATLLSFSKAHAP